MTLLFREPHLMGNDGARQRRVLYPWPADVAFARKGFREDGHPQRRAFATPNAGEAATCPGIAREGEATPAACDAPYGIVTLEMHPRIIRNVCLRIDWRTLDARHTLV